MPASATRPAAPAERVEERRRRRRSASANQTPYASQSARAGDAPLPSRKRIDERARARGIRPRRRRGRRRGRAQPPSAPHAGGAIERPPERREEDEEARPRAPAEVAEEVEHAAGAAAATRARAAARYCGRLQARRRLRGRCAPWRSAPPGPSASGRRRAARSSVAARDVALRAGDDERRVAELVARVHVGAVLEQEAMTSRWSPPAAWKSGVRCWTSRRSTTAPVLDEVARRCRGSRPSAAKLSGVRPLTSGSSTARPCSCSQRTSSRLARVHDGEEERRAAELVLRVHVRAALERALDGGAVVRG